MKHVSHDIYIDTWIDLDRFETRRGPRSEPIALGGTKDAGHELRPREGGPFDAFGCFLNLFEFLLGAEGAYQGVGVQPRPSSRRRLPEKCGAEIHRVLSEGRHEVSVAGAGVVYAAEPE